MIELRFFRERYNTSYSYYAGNKDVYCRLYFKTAKELESKWKHLMCADGHALEGETYCAWFVKGGKPREILCGGAFDPGDIDSIMNVYEGCIREYKGVGK